MSRLIISIQRRYRLIDFITSLGSLVIRSYIKYSRRGLIYIVHPLS
jgi:hypothetical protein